MNIETIDDYEVTLRFLSQYDEETGWHYYLRDTFNSFTPSVEISREQMNALCLTLDHEERI